MRLTVSEGKSTTEVEQPDSNDCINNYTGSNRSCYRSLFMFFMGRASRKGNSLRSKPADKERLIGPASGYECLLLSLVELIEVLTGLKNKGEQN